MKTNKIVIIINGGGGVGKDTLVNAVENVMDIENISAITPIKEIAEKYGDWHGEKDNRSRKFLSDLKRLFVEYNDLPTNYLYGQYIQFMVNANDVLFMHIREISEIEKIKSMIKQLPCVTLLVTRESCKQTYGNASDDDVENYDYDYRFENDKPLEESKQDFITLIQKIYSDMYPNESQNL